MILNFSKFYGTNLTIINAKYSVVNKIYKFLYMYILYVQIKFSAFLPSKVYIIFKCSNNILGTESICKHHLYSTSS